MKGAYAAAVPRFPRPSVELMNVMVVPVRGAGTVALRCGRLPSGERVGIAFSDEKRLAEVMGADQPWIHLSLDAQRAMLAPLGIQTIQVDPGLLAKPVTPLPALATA